MKDMTDWNELVQRLPGGNIWLEEAPLRDAPLEKAAFTFAHLEKADLLGGQLKNAYFGGTHLEEACLNFANIEGTRFIGTHIENTEFKYAICDGSTQIINCFMNKKSDLRGVALDNIQWSPGLKQLAEYNNRRLNWIDWYKAHPALKWPFKAFWYFSDYGRSGTQVMKWFCYFSVLFAWAYFCWPEMTQGLYHEGMPAYIIVFRAVYFSVVTMTTLGFGDIHANPLNFWGHILLMIQVILGYVILGALVTRLSILFNSDGPAADFTKPDFPKSWTHRLKDWWKAIQST